MVSYWYVVAASVLGIIGIAAALWKGGKVFAVTLARKPFWIVVYHHKHGSSSWPVFCKNQPNLDYLLDTDDEFRADWEMDGEESGEWIDVTGPWYVGMNLLPESAF